MAQLGPEQNLQQDEEYDRNQSQLDGYDQPEGAHFQEPRENKADVDTPSHAQFHSSEPGDTGAQPEQAEVNPEGEIGRDAPSEVPYGGLKETERNPEGDINRDAPPFEEGYDGSKEEGDIGRDAPSSEVGYVDSNAEGTHNEPSSENTGSNPGLEVPTQIDRGQHGSSDDTPQNVDTEGREFGTAGGAKGENVHNEAGSENTANTNPGLEAPTQIDRGQHESLDDTHARNVDTEGRELGTDGGGELGQKEHEAQERSYNNDEESLDDTDARNVDTEGSELGTVGDGELGQKGYEAQERSYNNDEESKDGAVDPISQPSHASRDYSEGGPVKSGEEQFPGSDKGAHFQTHQDIGGLPYPTRPEGARLLNENEVQGPKNGQSEPGNNQQAGYSGGPPQEYSTGSEVRDGVPHGVVSGNIPSGAGLESEGQNPAGNYEQPQDQQTGPPSGTETLNDREGPTDNIEQYQNQQADGPSGVERSNDVQSPAENIERHPYDQTRSPADGSRDQAGIYQGEAPSSKAEGEAAVDNNQKKGFIAKLKEKLPGHKHSDGDTPVDSEPTPTTEENAGKKPSLATKIKDKFSPTHSDGDTPVDSEPTPTTEENVEKKPSLATKIKDKFSPSHRQHKDETYPEPVQQNL